MFKKKFCLYLSLTFFWAFLIGWGFSELHAFGGNKLMGMVRDKHENSMQHMFSFAMQGTEPFVSYRNSVQFLEFLKQVEVSEKDRRSLETLISKELRNRIPTVEKYCLTRGYSSFREHCYAELSRARRVLKRVSGIDDAAQ